ncbi:MAG: PIG-L family deacetylase [Phycisphaerae bacterium]|nr:PIG-L family deacetylase [Phycisphaerae bacterium]
MNVLVVGAHPDDQELGMGGTIARLTHQGHRVLLLDLTNGEPTPHGSPEARASESAKAAAILGAERRTLDLPNRSVVASLDARRAVAAQMRLFRPDIVFMSHPDDAHPDHVAGARLVADARFEAKLTRTDLPGEPIYPRWFLHYYATHLRTVPAPSFIMDTTGFHARKREAILAYRTQFVLPEANRKVVDWLDASATFFGSRIGCESGEPFFAQEPLGLAGFQSVVGCV